MLLASLQYDFLGICMMRLLLWNLIMSEALGVLTFGQPYYGYEICVYSTFFAL
jgi:hypothetical protein